jgi:hypothetical protein
MEEIVEKVVYAEDGVINVEAVRAFFDNFLADCVKSNGRNKAAGRRVRVGISEFKNIVSKELKVHSTH